MKLRRIALLSALGSIGALSSIGAAGANAAPVWNVDLHHNQTHFAPGGKGQYWVDIDNVGDSASSGTITLKVTLPSGITRSAIWAGGVEPISQWSCPGAVGAKSFTCTSSQPIARHTLYRSLVFSVNIAEAEGPAIRTAKAKVEGGGAAVAASAKEPTPIDPQPTGFGIFAPSFEPDFFAADGVTLEREAGAHPDLLSVPFDFNSIAFPNPGGPQGQMIPAGFVRDLRADAPPGFLGNPSAVGECSQAEFTVAECPPSSQVGRIDLGLFPLSFGGESSFGNFTPISTPVYNLIHPRGSVSDLAFVVASNPVHIKASLDPANHYAIVTEVPQINETLPPFNQKLTLWGIPADHSHDSERCGNHGGFAFPTDEECSTDATPKPFLTLPSQCEDANTWRLHHYDSWQEQESSAPRSTTQQPIRSKKKPKR